MNIQIPYKVFKRKLKLRYPIVALLIIFATLIFPYFFPIDADYSPVKSIESNHDYGHSQLGNVLKSQYQVTMEHLDITKYHDSKFQTLIIISPDRNFKQKEIDFLIEWRNQNKNLVLIGLTSAIIHLNQKLFSITINPEDNLLDYSGEHENVNYVDVKMQGSSVVYTAVSPSYYEINSNTISIDTLHQSEKRSCVEEKRSCLGINAIGEISLSRNFIGIYDDWMFRNKFVSKFSTNLDLIPLALSLLSNTGSGILIDESHYVYAPLNQKGVESVIYALRESQMYRGLILFFAVILPIVLGFFSGVLVGQNPKDKYGLGKKLMSRLDRLYIDKIVAAPLSLEERVLVNEKLETLTRKHNYFQYVARLYLDYIEKKNLPPYIPEDLMRGLQHMEIELISNQNAWQLIKVINFAIEKAKIRQREEKDVRVYTSEIPGLPEVM